jgi:hypothetical protein
MQDSECRIQDSGFRIQGSAVMMVAWFLRKGWDSDFGQDSGFRIQGSAIMSVACFLGKG